MTTLQKVIKYLAIAFAISLIVGIIGGVLQTVGLISIATKSSKVSEDLKEYEISAEIKELDIDISAAECVISTGEAFKVESNLKELSVKADEGVLSIIEKHKGSIHYSGNPVLNIVIPEDMVFDSLKINTKAAKLTADSLSADELIFELGAGMLKISELNVFNNAYIEGGAGSLNIDSGTINNLEADMGLGEFNFRGVLTGKCELDQGVGAAELHLLGDADDYTIEVDKGLGSIRIDGNEVHDGDKLGEGRNHIELDGGVGSVEIEFE